MPFLLEYHPEPPDKSSNRSSSHKPTSHRSTTSIRDGSRSGRPIHRSGSPHNKGNMTQQDADSFPDRGSDEWRFGKHERVPSIRDRSRSGRRRSHSGFSKDKDKITQQDPEDLGSLKRDRSRAVFLPQNEVEDKPGKISAGGTMQHSVAPHERGQSHRPSNTDEYDGKLPPKPRPSVKQHRSPSRSSHKSWDTPRGGPRRDSIAPPGGVWVPQPRDTARCDGPFQLIPPFEPGTHRSRSHSSHKSGKVYKPNDTTASPLPRPPSSSSQRRTGSRSSQRSGSVVPPEMVLSPAVSPPELLSSQHRTHSRISQRSEDIIPEEEAMLSPNRLHDPSSGQRRTHSRASHRSEDIVPQEGTLSSISLHERPSSQHRTHSRSSHKSNDIIPHEEARLPPNDRPSGQRGRSSRSLRRSEDIVPAERETTATAARNLSHPLELGRVRSCSRPSAFLSNDREEHSASRKSRKHRDVSRDNRPPVAHYYTGGHRLVGIGEDDFTGSHVANLGSGFNGDSESFQLDLLPLPHCVRKETPLREKTRKEKMEIYQERIRDPNRRWVKSLCRDPKTGKKYGKWTP